MAFTSSLRVGQRALPDLRSGSGWRIGAKIVRDCNPNPTARVPGNRIDRKGDVVIRDLIANEGPRSRISPLRGLSGNAVDGLLRSILARMHPRGHDDCEWESAEQKSKAGGQKGSLDQWLPVDAGHRPKIRPQPSLQIGALIFDSVHVRHALDLEEMPDEGADALQGRLRGLMVRRVPAALEQ